jgi:hypothetical protein
MKRCPQCEFIYEDDQRLCDMDGRDLVYDPGPVLALQKAATEQTLLQKKAPWRSYTLAAITGVIALSVFFVVDYAVTRHSPSVNLSQATAGATTAQRPESDLVPVLSPAFVETPSPEGSSSPMLTPSSSAKSSTAPRVSSSPISAGGSVGKSRGPAIIVLTNGASIKADQVWERRDGIWYRQGSVVSFLKRNRARTIQRLALPQSAVPKLEDRKPKPEVTIAKNQTAMKKPDSVDAKKESRIHSLLMKTGRVLKKPFKF